MSWIVGIEGLYGAFPDGCALTMGVFDGVHRGHRALIESVVCWARAHGVPAVAMTFHPHPAAVLNPERRPPMLCSLAHRVQRLLQYGVDWVVIQPFTSAFAQLSAEQFIKQILIEGLNARAVVVGDDFQFGRGRGGSVQTLRQTAAFETVTVAGVHDDAGERISSTRIRELVESGQIAHANALLGEPLTWTGVVVRGDGRGRTLGYPTANLVPIEPLITPQAGVYACLAWVEPLQAKHGQDARATQSGLDSPVQASTHGQESGLDSPVQASTHGQECPCYAAAVSVGKPPMFENARGRIEAYLIDFPDSDLYGRTLTLQFLQRLRSQQVFDSVEALLHQMANDVARARLILQEVQSHR